MNILKLVTLDRVFIINYHGFGTLVKRSNVEPCSIAKYSSSRRETSHWFLISITTRWSLIICISPKITSIS